MKATVVRKEHFNAAHRLFRADWTDEKNFEIFGLCSRPNFHGHNYELFVKVTGNIDPETGFVFDLKILKGIIREHIIDKFDHRNLNLDTEEFKELNPTVENIAMVIYRLLQSKIGNEFEVSVKLYETERNFVEYPAHQ
jgi:6-pyruvoyltetrahydropterin/6-carboxytetrahydropterin synthase